jgi:hypothetical protein
LKKILTYNISNNAVYSNYSLYSFYAGFSQNCSKFFYVMISSLMAHAFAEMVFLHLLLMIAKIPNFCSSMGMRLHQYCNCCKLLRVHILGIYKSAGVEIWDFAVIWFKSKRPFLRRQRYRCFLHKTLM